MLRAQRQSNAKLLTICLKYDKLCGRSLVILLLKKARICMEKEIYREDSKLTYSVNGQVVGSLAGQGFMIYKTDGRVYFLLRKKPEQFTDKDVLSVSEDAVCRHGFLGIWQHK